MQMTFVVNNKIQLNLEPDSELEQFLLRELIKDCAKGVVLKLHYDEADCTFYIREVENFRGKSE